MLKYVAAASISAMLAISGMSAAQAAGVSLIAGPAADAKTAVTKVPRNAARSRLVQLNAGALFSGGAPRGADTMPEVSFDLFDNAKFTGVVKTVETNDGTTTWSGDLKGVVHGYFYLVAVDGAVIAHVASPQGVYEVSNVGGETYRVIQLDQTKNKEDFPKVLPAGKAVDQKSDAGTGDAASPIDVIVFYTDDARAGEGSIAAMRARVALAVAETNGSYANSGITPRLRLVHTEELNFAESGDIDTDLTNFVANATAQSVRTKFGADMASLVTENGGGYCGLADAIMATTSTAFDVTARDCATGYYSFGHEFGHLQGARHDPYVDSTNTPYAYGHGYTYRAGAWRTVMAYNNACSDFGVNCTRLQYFSNPTKKQGTINMGVVGTNENYKVLNTTAGTVANFVTRVIGNAFNSTFNGSKAGWLTVKGIWTSGATYYSTAGLSNNGASARHNSNYGDLTYRVRMKRSGNCTSCANRLFIRGDYTHQTSTNQWYSSYMFQYTNDGQYSVFRIDNTGASTALVTWTTSSAIVKKGWNVLKVVAVGHDFRFYINNTVVWNGSDSNLALGAAGIGMYRDATSTGNKLDVDLAVLSNTPTSSDVTATADAPAAVAGGGGSNADMAN